MCSDIPFKINPKLFWTQEELSDDMILNSLEISKQNLSEVSNTKFYENPLSEFRDCHATGQRDGRSIKQINITKLLLAFKSCFEQEPKSIKIFILKPNTSK